MVQLVADSTCDIPKETRDKLGIIMVPLTVFFEDGAYRDGIDLSFDEFYEKLGKASKLPTTAQVNPSEFENVFRKIINKGDDVVCVCIAKELSGTMGSAIAAAEAVDPSRIHCVDSTCGTFGAYLIINQAVKMRDQGLSAKEIAEKAQALANRIRFFAMVDTLKYLKMGGRLSGTAAFLGGLLDIHPIIQVRHGTITAVGKVRGRKAALPKLLELFKSEPADFTYGLAFGHSNSPGSLVEIINYFKPYIEKAEIITGNLGAVIGSHIGPGAVGIAYIAK